MAGTLYLVPTPIGNLGDISPRSIQALEEADFVAAEDTRVTLKLLSHLGLKKSMVSYHRHNTEKMGQAVLDRLLSGESCALVTDAGTPAISDPGEELVAQCARQDIPVVAIPGPCALVTALAVSGQPTGRFTFEGFLPMNKKNRRARLEALRGEERTMLFYEAPHKLPATLSDLAETFGADRPVSLCRELTKLHEEVRRTTLGEAARWYQENLPRGEFVLVVRGAQPAAPEEAILEDGLELAGRLRTEGLSLRDSVRRAAQELGLSRNELYRLALERELQGERGAAPVLECGLE
ncbi:MAG: 16S rRNA (cytidine(1402)-2'-O)-methyltransferase [Lawsonibacter sp.]|nr:16S rRNA (cytidine(1402)-2'-O)-methyltransferase [Lawsonibacter sp.]